MTTKNTLKQISIDELVPGMFVADMNLAWYRTPFLSHKRLIKDLTTIQVMKRHGIRTVTIDTSKGKDVSRDSVGGQMAGAAALPGQSSAGMDVQVQPPTDSVQALYTEAQEAVERIFTELEQGLPPHPAKTRAVVSKVLARIINDRTALMTHLAIQKVKQFDRSLAAHSLDTCILSLLVGVESGLEETLLVHLGAGALLHDAGYTRLPRNLVRRRDECTEQERVLLQEHPKLGIALLTEEPGIHEEVKRIVAEHHECANGSGFPAKLQNDSISPLAKIVGIVDSYDGMVSRRGGRPAMLPHNAVRQLFLAGERGQFEKPLVENVIRCVGVYPVGSLVRLNTGEQALVVGVNSGDRLKPLVKIIGGPQGESYANPLLIDLSAQSQDRGARTVLRVLDPLLERVNIAMYLDEAAPQAA